MGPRGVNTASRGWRAKRLVPSRFVCVAALVAAAAMLPLFAPAAASAIEPVLEFVAPGHGLPVSFTTESGPVSAEMVGFEALMQCSASRGEGEITGPRSAVAEYAFTGCVANHSKATAQCKSDNASAEEIKTGPIAAELVYVNQEKREVAILLNPSGGIYMKFECGGESAEGRGPFLAAVVPLNKETTSFTASLSELESMQLPDEYENEAGEMRTATPEGRRGEGQFVKTGVQAAFTVHTSVPVEIRAMTIADIEVGQREEKQHAEEATLAAAAKKHQEEAAAAAKRHQEEEAADAQRRQEEEAAARQKRENQEKLDKAKQHKRAQLLAKALRACAKQRGRRRARCIANAHRRYGVAAPKKKGKHGRPRSSGFAIGFTLLAARFGD